MRCVTLLLGLAILMASVVAAAPAPAAGTEVPAQYRGLWCHDQRGTYYRCRVGNSDSSPDIHRNYLILTEEGRCSVVTVTPKAGGHRLHAYSPSHGGSSCASQPQ
jgi:hypothetical protein